MKATTLKAPTSYVFVLSHLAYPIEEQNVFSFKEAIGKLADYSGEYTELFQRCLNGFDDDDVDGLISLYEHFVSNHIVKIYAAHKFFFWSED